MAFENYPLILLFEIIIHYFTILLASFVEHRCLLWTKHMVYINSYSTADLTILIGILTEWILKEMNYVIVFGMKESWVPF